MARGGAGSSSRPAMARATCAGLGGTAHEHPGDPVLHRLAGTARGAGHLGDPGGGGLEEDDPEALLLEPEPTGSGTAWRRRRRPRPAGAGPRRTRRRAGGPARPTRPPGRPAARRPGPDRRWPPSGRGTGGASRAAASIRTSMPLRGTRRLTLTTSGPWAGRPRSARARRPVGGVERGEPSRSTPGRDLDHRRHAPPPERPAGLGRRDSRRPTRPARRRARRGPAADRLTGRRPGMATSAPWSRTA